MEEARAGPPLHQPQLPPREEPGVWPQSWTHFDQAAAPRCKIFLPAPRGFPVTPTWHSSSSGQLWTAGSHSRAVLGWNVLCQEPWLHPWGGEELPTAPHLHPQ